MTSLLSYRRVTVSIAGLLFLAAAAAVSPVYALFPARLPDGWLSPLLVGLIVAYAAGGAVLGLWACVLAIVWGGRAFGNVAGTTDVRAAAGHPGWVRHRQHAVALAFLAALVLAESGLNVFTGSGYWASGRPQHETHASAAEGHVAWFDGLPVHEESFYAWGQVDTLSRRQANAPVLFQGGIARTGHAAYAFYVALLARIVSPVAGSYAAFVVVNALFLFLGAAATYDLARRARSSWWAGVLAAVVFVMGVGIPFSVANAMSFVAAYAGVPIILWLVERLRVFAPDTSMRDLVLVAVLAGLAGLMYGLGPVYIGVVVLNRIGRTELRRLLVWSAVVLAVGQVWAQVLKATAGVILGAGSSGYLALTPVTVAASALALAAIVLACVLPARLVDRVIGGVVLVGVVVGIVGLAVAPAVAQQVTNALSTSMQVPRYLGDAGDIAAQFADRLLGEPRLVFERLRASALDQDVLAAFPLTLCALALLGAIRMPGKWIEWCASLMCVIGLM
ncbi:MAG TPA: hypothetical protein VNM48_23755, partial [Chloroflexota bacterium]|nr:hypothetical protein [Chloroflexota bacterium]